MYVRTKEAKNKTYIQLVESRRVDGKPRQRVVLSLGRMPEDEATGLAIAEAIARFFTKSRPVLGTEILGTRDFGAIFAIRKFWERLKLNRILKKYADARRFDFCLESAVFHMVCNRLIRPKSKLGCAEWISRCAYYPVDSQIDSDQLYDAMTWLEKHQDDIELDLFRRLQRADPDRPIIIFYDTTITSFFGAGGSVADFTGRKGAPKGRKSILIGLIRTRAGWPVTHWIFPGSTRDTSTVADVLFDLKDRFGIDHCVFVSDRGMISKNILELLELMEFKYVIATRLRRDKEVRDVVLTRGGRYRTVSENLEVKEVRVNDRRYIICRNEAAVQRDRNRRKDILDKLRSKLAESDRADTQAGRKLLVNGAYKRYLIEHGNRLRISEDAVRKDGRFDGRWVIRTNIESGTAVELAALYKEEASIEHDFRDLKSVFELAPVRHHKDERIRAHVFLCVLAKYIECAMRKALDEAGFRGTSVDAVLEELTLIKVTKLRTPSGTTWVRPPLTDIQEKLFGHLGISPRGIPAHFPDYDPGTPRKIRLDNGAPLIREVPE